MEFTEKCLCRCLRIKFKMQSSKFKITNQKSKFFEQVYKVVSRIPEGKVMTYGQIAKILGTRDARKVGWALHGNSDPKIPCHRVLNKEGAVASNYAFGGGWKEQKMRLIAEGVRFKDEMHVDLDIYLWAPKL